MFEVTFSDQSMQELNKLDHFEQLKIVERISNLTLSDLDQNNEEIGHFIREKKTFYRLRHGDFRIYFERKDEELFTHFFLHKNTFSDFVFRCKLPMTSEQALEENQSFWKYLENLGKQDADN